MKNKKNTLTKAILRLAVFSLALILCAGLTQGNVWAKSKKKASKKPAVQSVSLLVGGQNYTNKTYQVRKKQNVQLKVVVNPSNAKKSIKYSTSNKKIATVNKKGKISVKKKNGTVKIKVKVTGKNNKSKTVWIKLKVVNNPVNQTVTPAPVAPAPQPAPSSNLAEQYSIDTGNGTVVRNDKFYKSVIYSQRGDLPSADNFSSIRWYSDNTNVVDVSTWGSSVTCMFKALRPGSANLKVDLVAKDGSTKTCSIPVTVNESPYYKVVNGVTFYCNRGWKTNDLDADIRAVEGAFNKNDVSIQITGASSRMVQNYADPNRKLPVDYSTYEYYGGIYEVGNWPNIYGYVAVNGCNNPNMVRIVSKMGTVKGSYSVTMYYKGSYVHTWNVAEETMNNEAKVLADCRKLEQECWTSNMTAEQKLHAFEKAFRDKYTYNGDGMTCLNGAQYLVIAARDLGLEAWARVFSEYRNGQVVYNYPGGFGDDYQFAAFITGFPTHVGIIAVINGKEVVFETQGH